MSETGILQTPILEEPPKQRTRQRNNRRRAPAAQGSATGEANDTPNIGSRTARLANELSDAGRRGAAKKTTANAQDWEEFLGIAAGFGSMLFAWWLASGTGITREERGTLELTDDEAEAIARPLSNIMERSILNRRYGKHVLGGSDYITLAIALVVYTERVSPYIRRKMATAIPRRNQTRGNVNNGRQRENVVAEETPPQQPINFGIYGANAT
jgi:hypothetical protein